MTRFIPNLLTVALVAMPTTAVAQKKKPAGNDGQTNEINSVAFSRDGKTFVTGGSQTAPNLRVDRGEIMFWDAKTAKMLHKLEAGFSVRAVVFSPDGNTLATGESSGEALSSDIVRLWDVKTRTQRVALERAIQPVVTGTSSLAFSPDGKMLVAGCNDFPGAVVFWDVETGKVQKPRSLGPGFAGTIVAVAFTPDGKTLAAGTDEGTIMLWDVDAGKTRHSFKGHAKDKHLRSLAVSPDGKTLASRAHDRTVKLWDMDSGKELGALPGVWGCSDLVFTSDSKTLAAGSSPTTSPDGTKFVGGVHLWDVESKKLQAVLKADTTVRYLALSPDGKKMVVARGTPEFELWSLGPPDPEPAKKEGDKAAVAKSADEKAAELLAKAKETLEAKNVALARIRLRNIVSEFPKTAAAVEAQRLLKTLEK